MKPLLAETRDQPLFWLLAFVPVVLAAQARMPDAPTVDLAAKAGAEEGVDDGAAVA